jgi:rhomboid family GlyGly-CTERM serine protease
MHSVNDSNRRTSHVPEFIVFGIALVVLNYPLLTGAIFDSAVFLPADVMAGEWWRVPAHPFVHLSWYHLLLDAGAFLLLYGGLDEPARWKRILFVIGCGLGSLILSTLTSPIIGVRGLCGLSGIAHGLMAVSALECMIGGRADRKTWLTGMVSFGVVVSKSIVEVLQGHVFFEFLHFGLMGLPIPACHAGGVLSGILMFLALGGARRPISEPGMSGILNGAVEPEPGRPKMQIDALAS